MLSLSHYCQGNVIINKKIFMHAIHINFPIAQIRVEHSAFFPAVYLLTREEILLLFWHYKTFFSVFTITLLQSMPHLFERVFLFSGDSDVFSKTSFVWLSHWNHADGTQKHREQSWSEDFYFDWRFKVNNVYLMFWVKLMVNHRRSVSVVYSDVPRLEAKFPYEGA